MRIFAKNPPFDAQPTKSYNYIINMMSSIEEAANKIPLLTIHAGPKDEKWKDRLKEELKAIITYIKSNK